MLFLSSGLEHPVDELILAGFWQGLSQSPTNGLLTLLRKCVVTRPGCSPRKDLVRDALLAVWPVQQCSLCSMICRPCCLGGPMRLHDASSVLSPSSSRSTTPWLPRDCPGSSYLFPGSSQRRLWFVGDHPITAVHTWMTYESIIELNLWTIKSKSRKPIIHGQHV